MPGGRYGANDLDVGDNREPGGLGKKICQYSAVAIINNQTVLEVASVGIQVSRCLAVLRPEFNEDCWFCCAVMCLCIGEWFEFENCKALLCFSVVQIQNLLGSMHLVAFEVLRACIHR